MTFAPGTRFAVSPLANNANSIKISCICVCVDPINHPSHGCGFPKPSAIEYNLPAMRLRRWKWPSHNLTVTIVPVICTTNIACCLAGAILVLVMFSQHEAADGADVLVESNLDFNSIPHVDECGICHKCLTTSCRRSALGTVGNWTASHDPIQRQGLPQCNMCKGCHHTLSRIDTEFHAFNRSFIPRAGFSSSWLFDVQETCGNSENSPAMHTVEEPNNAGQTQSIVKVWCLPYENRMLRQELWAIVLGRFGSATDEQQLHPTQTGKMFEECDWELAEMNMKIELAVVKVAEACGLDHLLPKVWVGPVKGVMPETGYPINWNGLWMSRAPGVSVHVAASWASDAETIERVLGTNINSSPVVQAAILDLLTVQCDRHSNNIFIDEHGNLTLIDNGEALGHGDLCTDSSSLSSLFLPSTHEHTHKAVGKIYTETGAPAFMLQNPLPHLLLDYRCHAQGGIIGKKYPLSVEKCLTRFKDTKPGDLVEELGLLNEEMARVLKQRSEDMLNEGFEWTLYHGVPGNGGGRRLVAQPACCSMHSVRPPAMVPWMFECNQEWAPVKNVWVK